MNTPPDHHYERKSYLGHMTHGTWPNKDNMSDISQESTNTMRKSLIQCKQCLLYIDYANTLITLTITSLFKMIKRFRREVFFYDKKFKERG